MVKRWDSTGIRQKAFLPKQAQDLHYLPPSNVEADYYNEVRREGLLGHEVDQELSAIWRSLRQSHYCHRQLDLEVRVLEVEVDPVN